MDELGYVTPRPSDTWDIKRDLRPWHRERPKCFTSVLESIANEIPVLSRAQNAFRNKTILIAFATCKNNRATFRPASAKFPRLFSLVRNKSGSGSRSSPKIFCGESLFCRNFLFTRPIRKFLFDYSTLAFNVPFTGI